MSNKAICKKVSSMLSLYIDNKVNYQERAFIEDHLSNCDECYKKFLYLKSLIKNLKDSYKQILELAIKKQKQAGFSIREHENFMENLSPYVDNELDAKECFEFRKYLMKSKMAQKELKNTYFMQKEMRIAFDKTKKKINTDLSKVIINTLKNKKESPFQSEIIRELFQPRTAKVAILSGLLLFGAYEIRNLSETPHPEIRQTIIKKYQSIPHKSSSLAEKIRESIRKAEF